MILEEDYECAKRTAESELHGIVRFLKSKIARQRAVSESAKLEIAHTVFSTKNSALLQKWCINFAALVMLHGSGQRAQVYAQLQVGAVAVNSSGHLVESVAQVEKASAESGHFS